MGKCTQEKKTLQQNINLNWKVVAKCTTTTKGTLTFTILKGGNEKS